VFYPLYRPVFVTEGNTDLPINLLALYSLNAFAAWINYCVAYCRVFADPEAEEDSRESQDPK